MGSMHIWHWIIVIIALSVVLLAVLLLELGKRTTFELTFAVLVALGFLLGWKALADLVTDLGDLGRLDFITIRGRLGLIGIFAIIAVFVAIYRYRKSSLSDNLEVPSVDTNTAVAPRGSIPLSPNTVVAKHEAPEKEEPKKRKPTENVSQRSPFDRGYKY